jgi:hypothetical protein
MQEVNMDSGVDEMVTVSISLECGGFMMIADGDNEELYRKEYLFNDEEGISLLVKKIREFEVYNTKTQEQL